MVCGLLISHCDGFSCCRAQALDTRASVVVARGLSSCGSRALEHRLSSCGTQAQLLHSMWDLPQPGFEPVPPALAGQFSTTVPPGKCPHFIDEETETQEHKNHLLQASQHITLSWDGVQSPLAVSSLSF